LLVTPSIVLSPRKRGSRTLTTVARSEEGITWFAGSQIPPTPVIGFMPSWPDSQQKYASLEYSNMVHDVSAHDGKFTTAVLQSESKYFQSVYTPDEEWQNQTYQKDSNIDQLEN
jgi:hypothetical protein